MAQSDGHDPPGLIDELVPRHTAVVDEIVVRQKINSICRHATDRENGWSVNERALINQLRAVLLDRGIVVPQDKRELEQYLVIVMNEHGAKGLSARMRMLVADIRAQWQNKTQPELVPNQASKSNIVRGALYAIRGPRRVLSETNLAANQT